MKKEIIQFDRAVIKGKTSKTDEGFLVCDAVVTRPGVFTYIVDGKPHRRYAPPEVVLDEKSYSTLALKPVTNGHPYLEPGQIISPANAKRLKIGTVGESIRIHDNDIMAKFVVTDSDAIEQIESGKRELSCGYMITLDNTPGTTPDGEKYDSKQTSRYYNHLSLERAGRVGNAKIILDSGIEIDGVQFDAEKLDNIKEVKHVELKTITLDSVSYEVAPDAVDKILNMKKQNEEKTAQLDAKSAESETLKADLDSAKKEIEELKKSQLDSEAIDKLATEKAEVLSVAKVELDAKEIDGKSIDELKIAVCKKAYEDINLDGKSSDYINATFDRSIEKLSKKDEKNTSVKSAPKTQLDKKDELSSFDKMVVGLENAHKKEVK